MSHGEAAHERGTHNMFTGYRPARPCSIPSMGSVVSHELGGRRNLPPYVCIPSQPNPYAGSGFLSAAYGPFSVGGDPGEQNFTVRDLNLPPDISPPASRSRKRLLATVDAHFRTMEESDALASMDSFYQRAYSLISSAEAREAFNLAAEPDALRDELRPQRESGQRMLLARRLVESGVRFVSVTAGSWDHHERIAEACPRQPAQPGPRPSPRSSATSRTAACSTRRWCMLTSEFGRTPKINKDGGRDHWPRVFSVVLAGGGIQEGLRARRLHPHRHRAGIGPGRRGGFRHHGLSPDGHRGRQGADGAGQPAHRDREGRPDRRGPDRVTWSGRTCIGLALAAALLAPRARAASPSVTRHAPMGGQRGTEVELTLLRGTAPGPQRAACSTGPGIVVRSLAPGATNRANQVRARLALAADCPLGEHPFRLRTAAGLTAVRIVPRRPVSDGDGAGAERRRSSGRRPLR
jgi:hypothetical protein